MLVAILIFVGEVPPDLKSKKKHGPTFIPGRLKFTMLNGIICELKHLHPELQLFSEFEGSMHVTFSGHWLEVVLEDLNFGVEMLLLVLRLKILGVMMCYAEKNSWFVNASTFYLPCFESHHSGRFWRFCTIIGFSYCLIRCGCPFLRKLLQRVLVPGINEIGCYLLRIPWLRAPQLTWSSLGITEKGGSVTTPPTGEGVI